MFIWPAALRQKTKAKQAAAAIGPQRPATIQEIVDADLPRSHELDSPGYLEKRDRIFRVMWG
ncbi:MAG: hypothetical protein DME99_00815 [Verrucomicrobia bacterium]|nr:MAG: hypothetical protein DME99_00815 [Verrucomicrobiota bacterium]